MRAIVVTRFGGPEVLELQDVPAPEAGPADLLVNTTVAGVNYRDIYEREGNYGGEAPLVAGAEGAGTVAATGERVVWAHAPGAYAERVAVAADRAVPIPDGLTDEQAAAVLLQGMTAHYLTHSTYPIQPGDEVLVHAGAGGAGRLTIQMAKLRGARVTATASTPEKRELAAQAGADETLRYDDVPAGRFHVVYDGVGAPTFDRSLAALRPRGMLVSFGAAGGRPAPVDVGRLNDGSKYLTRPTLHTYAQEREELVERAAAVLGWVADGTLDVLVGGTYRLEEARRAQEDLESRRTTGKLLLTI
jgi:NADPH:quinone reductase